MSKQELLLIAAAIPVISYIAVQATKKILLVVSHLWGWFLRTIADQTAGAIRDIMAPPLETLHSDLMESIEQLRDINARDHVEVQIRLRDVEVRLGSVEERLAAVELQLKGDTEDAVVDGTSSSVGVQGADGGRRAGDGVRRDP